MSRLPLQPARSMNDMNRAKRRSPGRVQALQLGLLAAAALLALPAAAQTTTPPDAGQTLRDLQRPPAAPTHAAPTLTVPAEADTAADSGQRFAVKTIRIEGAQIMAADELHALVAGLEGTEASLGELRQAARRITTLYRERGYVVARAYLPAQEIRDGMVTISVLEGRLGASSVSNGSTIASARLQALLDAQVPAGNAIEAGAMDRALLLLADLPAVGRVSGNLKPGDRVGTSDLVIAVEAGKKVEGDVSLDNYGNRYTGATRLSGRVDVNSPFDIGDRLGLRATLSDQHLLYGRAAYDLPLGSGGLRAGAALSSSRYELGHEFARLDASGTARTAGVYASYPVLRGLERNVWLSLNIEQRRLRDDVHTTDTRTDKRARVATLEAYGDLSDMLAGGGYNNWRIGGSFGRLAIETAAAQAADQAGPNAAGGYNKLQLSLSRVQRLAAATSLSLALSGQSASRNLDSSEKFSIGGVYGVRAYPQGEGVGDEGWLGNVELRQDLTPALQASLFYDHGRVSFSHTPYAAGNSAQTLRGYGAGLAAGYRDFSVKAAVAWRDGAAATTAPDRRPRGWLLAGWRF